ncbi:MAG: ribonuclease E/G [Alphaproteobacteria bacterium]|jgi:Rne/Rng family ribonuclease
MRFLHGFSPAAEVTALFREDRPFGVWIQRAGELLPGTICAARAVKKVGEAWFLDIGAGRSAFLPSSENGFAPDGTPCRTPLSEGARRIVQIRRSSFDGKEAKATGRISLAGTRAVYVPGGQGISFSRRFGEEARRRFSAALSDRPGGIIVRTAAEDAGETETVAELNELEKQWRSVLSRAEAGEGILSVPPSWAEQAAEKYRTEITEAFCDSPEARNRLKTLLPFIGFLTDGRVLRAEIDAAVDEARMSSAPLPSGGSLITETTAACVCFDVNAGSGNRSDANREACAEILRQIRLKGLSGQMIIDFAGKKEKSGLNPLLRRLKSPDMALDVWGISNLGLVEMTLERRRPSVFESCGGGRWEAIGLVRDLWFADASGSLTAYAPAEVLEGVRPFVAQIEKRLGCAVELRPENDIRIEGLRR